MKKLKWITLCLLCTLLIGSTVSAAAETYTLDELNMQITMPEGWVNLDRNSENPNFDGEIFNAEELVPYYEQNNIYLNSIRSDYLSELVVTKVEYDGSESIFDFNSFSDKELDKIANEMYTEDTVLQSGIHYTDHSIYQQEQAKFMVMDFYQEAQGSKVYSRQYYTIINGKAINVTLHSYNGELSEEDLQAQKAAVDSIHFNEILKKPFSQVFKALLPTILAVVVTCVIIAAVVIIVQKQKKRRTALAEQGTSSYPGMNPAGGTNYTGLDPLMQNEYKPENPPSSQIDMGTGEVTDYSEDIDKPQE
ncbi:hypothetical protein [Anaerolentibacter hominis]|uniref:hypothetical protein n=1 Tax=Anaerolentibacter hominis TaxID=3079009 RepID=UPI0031B7EE49